MVTYRTLCKRCTRYAIIGQAYRRWYRVARAVIRRLATYQAVIPEEKLYRDVCYDQLCDIVAITSPRVSVKRNLRFAWNEFTGKPRPGDMMRSTRVALDHYYKTGEIRGPKTSRFAQVLRGDDSVVVVDSWMARALGVRDKDARNKSTQELAERVITYVSLNSNRSGVYWSRAETQAAVWAGMIRTHYDRGKIPIMRVEHVGFERAGSVLHLSNTPF